MGVTNRIGACPFYFDKGKVPYTSGVCENGKGFYV